MKSNVENLLNNLSAGVGLELFSPGQYGFKIVAYNSIVFHNWFILRISDNFYGTVNFTYRPSVVNRYSTIGLPLKSYNPQIHIGF